MLQANTITVETKIQIPKQLYTDVQTLVTSGWYRNTDDLLLDAIRRLIESRRIELQEEFIQNDEFQHAPYFKNHSCGD